MSTPAGAIGHFDGLYYKFGRFNWVFFWDGQDWVKSNKSAEWLKTQAKINV